MAPARSRRRAARPFGAAVVALAVAVVGLPASPAAAADPPPATAPATDPGPEPTPAEAGAVGDDAVGDDTADVPAPDPGPEPVPVDADVDGDGVADVLAGALEAIVADREPAGAAVAAGIDEPTVDVIARLAPGADPLAVAAEAGAESALALDVIDAVALTVGVSEVWSLIEQPAVTFVAPDLPVEAFNGDGGTAIGAPAARAQSGAGGAGVVVAVLDTGIDATHVDLDGGKVVAWHDVVAGLPSPYDDHGHGTHVAATTAGSGDGNPALVGVAPQASLVGVKVLNGAGNGSMSQVISGIDWVVLDRPDLGVDVINLSLGFAGCTSGTDALSDAVRRAVASGIVVVTAAGNEGPGRCTIGSPAAAAAAISVGAVQVRTGGPASPAPPTPAGAPPPTGGSCPTWSPPAT
jgi:serine protease AprX